MELGSSLRNKPMIRESRALAAFLAFLDGGDVKSGYRARGREGLKMEQANMSSYEKEFHYRLTGVDVDHLTNVYHLTNVFDTRLGDLLKSGDCWPSICAVPSSVPSLPPSGDCAL